MVKILALVPARGGSKGIPLKNIKQLGNHPLIAYSIAAGQQANLVNRTIVSTDDARIAGIARDYGADVPFIRPGEFARDDTRDLPVFQHALDWLAENEDFHPDLVVQLRPTSPFRPSRMVDEAVQILLDHSQAGSVRGVIPAKQNPYKMWQAETNGALKPLLESDFSEPYNMPRQELPPTFWQTGHIDVIRSETIRSGSMSGEVIYPYHIDPLFSVDLDNPLDWNRAEDQLAALGGKIIRPKDKPGDPLRKLALLVLDFDGVLTDDRVYVDQNGTEMVAAHRGDGMGIALAKKAGIEVVILSTEKNPVVQARARKLSVPVFQGIDRKDQKLKEIITDYHLEADQVAFVGNDINDLPCFPLVGLSVCVADSHFEVLRTADLVLSRQGGQGAVREFIDLVLHHKGAKAGLEE